MKPGFGIVGCGMIADFHARALASLPAVQLAGCVNRLPESAREFAEKHGCRHFPTVEAMVSDDAVDVVSICTPSGAHLEPALLAAAQGIDFHHPKKSSAPIESVMTALREISPHYVEDRSLSSDVRRVAATIDHGDYCQYAESILPSMTR